MEQELLFENEKAIFKCEESGSRIDTWLALALSDSYSDRSFSRSGIKKLIEQGAVSVCGNVIKPSYVMQEGDIVEVMIPEPEILNVMPENIPLDIVYEDRDIIIINKPRGMVVHPAPGTQSGTLVNALLYYCKDLSDINGIIRPGIVHRIDKDTTGLIAVAKNNTAHIKLAEQLSDHTMARIYYAVLEGVPKTDCGTIDMKIGRHPVDRKKMAVNVQNGREAVTHFRVLEVKNNFALCEMKLETGRTHQIRVHMQAIGHPIAGDPLYGIKNTRGLAGQMLHAGKLKLIHPTTGNTVEFSAPVPDDFRGFLKKNQFEVEL